MEAQTLRREPNPDPLPFSLSLSVSLSLSLSLSSPTYSFLFFFPLQSLLSPTISSRFFSCSLFKSPIFLSALFYAFFPLFFFFSSPLLLTATCQTYAMATRRYSATSRSIGASPAGQHLAGVPLPCEPTVPSGTECLGSRAARLRSARRKRASSCALHSRCHGATRRVARLVGGIRAAQLRPSKQLKVNMQIFCLAVTHHIGAPELVAAARRRRHEPARRCDRLPLPKYGYNSSPACARPRR